MLPLALLPASVAVSIDGVVLDGVTVTLSLRTTSATASCPLCDQPSHHVHSRYARTVRDLPSLGKRTVLLLTARKFFCRNPACPREVFCERLPDLAPAYARSSSRLTDAHRAIAFALGGEAGSRLAGTLGMPASPDTLLRRIGQTPTTDAPTPRVLGVDDWALRKGQHYGTILVDLERERVIDLLPGRDGSALREWLQAHPRRRGHQQGPRQRVRLGRFRGRPARDPGGRPLAPAEERPRDARTLLRGPSWRDQGRVGRLGATAAQPCTYD